VSEDKTTIQDTRMIGIKTRRKPRLCKRCGALSPTTATLTAPAPTRVRIKRLI
jgi:hypothetical protein